VGYPFYSYLTYSAKYLALSTSQQAAVKAALPVPRTGADEPTAGAGSTSAGVGYARNGIGVTRNVFHAF
jgi:hypothetical protein